MNKILLKLMAGVVAILAVGAAFAQCTSVTINSEMPRQVVGLRQDRISELLGCMPTSLGPEPSVPQASETYSWGFVDGALKKQVSAQFDSAGWAISARYEEIPLLPGRSSRDDNSDAQAAVAIALMLEASGTASSVESSEAVSLGKAMCTPASINPAAVPRIRPHMTVEAVSAVLGCTPTELPPTTTFPLGVWVWGVPAPVAVAQGYMYQRVSTVMDEAGVAFAMYTFSPIASIRPEGNTGLRVEPPLPAQGNWVRSTVGQ